MIAPLPQRHDQRSETPLRLSLTVHRNWAHFIDCFSCHLLLTRPKLNSFTRQFDCEIEAIVGHERPLDHSFPFSMYAYLPGLYVPIKLTVPNNFMLCIETTPICAQSVTGDSPVWSTYVPFPISRLRATDILHLILKIDKSRLNWNRITVVTARVSFCHSNCL